MWPVLRPGMRVGAVGGAEGDRTPDLLIANEALSQLSYSPPFPKTGRIMPMGAPVKQTTLW